LRVDMEPLLVHVSIRVRHLPSCTLFPYTTLFRSEVRALDVVVQVRWGKKDVSFKVLHGSAAVVEDVQLRNGRYPRKTVSACHSRSEEHTSELQSPDQLVCRLLLEKKNNSERFQLS